jgi:hypothetical protein
VAIEYSKEKEIAGIQGYLGQRSKVPFSSLVILQSTRFEGRASSAWKAGRA